MPDEPANKANSGNNPKALDGPDPNAGALGQSRAPVSGDEFQSQFGAGSEPNVPTFDTVFLSGLVDLPRWITTISTGAPAAQVDAAHAAIERALRLPTTEQPSIVVVRQTRTDDDITMTHAVVGDLIFIGEALFDQYTTGQDGGPFLRALVDGLETFEAVRRGQNTTSFQKVTLGFADDSSETGREGG